MTDLYRIFIAFLGWINENSGIIFLGFLLGLAAFRRMEKHVFRPYGAMLRALRDYLYEEVEDEYEDVDEDEERVPTARAGEKNASVSVVYDQEAFHRANIRLGRAYAGKNRDGDLEIIAMVSGDDFKARPGYRLMLDAVFRDSEGNPRYSFVLGRLELEVNDSVVAVHDYIVNPERLIPEDSEVLLLPRWEQVV